jgi:abortive infection bacteriophage resistance protein
MWGQMEYAKPHLDYNDQVSLMIARGLHIPDRTIAVRALQRIGYYRLSAYTYPLRAPATDGTSARQAEFVAGARLHDVLALYEFDDRLRTLLLSGLQRLEIILRVQVGYTLGKVDPHAHLDPLRLHTDRCAEPTSDGKAAHDDWLERYHRLQSDAAQEEYVRHFILRYDGHIPVWVATEFLTFGALTRLFSMMPDKQANQVAMRFGLPGQRDLLDGWLRSLNTLRNHCAHNARIWNRATVFPPKRPAPRIAPERIHHLRQADNNRVYFLAALCAQLLIEADPTCDWARQFRTQMRKFPSMNGMTPENSMGFPAGWEQLALWAHEPVAKA